MLKRLIQVTIVCTVAALTSSCVTPAYRLQDGNYKRCEGTPPPDKIATLIINGFYVAAVDGLPPNSSYYLMLQEAKFHKIYKGNELTDILRFELLPGGHTITVGFGGSPGSYYSVSQLTITFNVEAGKVYTVIKSVDTANQTWNAWVEETNIK